ncbi:fibrillin-1 [Hyalella azteca]|uniref:Fibrillin-1 n=1 Tax=Hyalella azteca TaxID=294128 RepID=A0A979FRK5_HYAAZ|nr:fibrillin-1 [Hyalella azteca]
MSIFGQLYCDLKPKLTLWDLKDGHKVAGTSSRSVAPLFLQDQQSLSRPAESPSRPAESQQTGRESQQTSRESQQTSRESQQTSRESRQTSQEPRQTSRVSTLVWSFQVSAQYNLGHGIQREIFFLNLEDGYFGCQVNESKEILQLFELSKLCDGSPNCFLASDENIQELKCSNDCPYTQGYQCVNGACLQGNCHCNDGFGGCGCETPAPLQKLCSSYTLCSSSLSLLNVKRYSEENPVVHTISSTSTAVTYVHGHTLLGAIQSLDENECKYRPCDVFASCTNTLGSYFCTCFPGYTGDGATCQDIDECQDPAVAGRCVDNAWCCNLPAHYTCKCNDGYTGDGYVQCADINECLNPAACGLNAICTNNPGNYTCSCPPGYIGNPYTGCADMDECSRLGACGPGALCTNIIGGHQCVCPSGLEGDPYSSIGCIDINECASSPCAAGARCADGRSNYTCACPPGFVGNPYNKFSSCRDVDECQDPQSDVTADAEVESTAQLIRTAQSLIEGSGSEENPAIDDQITPTNWSYPCGTNALCHNVPGSFKCQCPRGYSGNAQSICYDINECGRPGVCGANAQCINTEGSHKCVCPQGFDGDPILGCTNINECASNPCGLNAQCLDKMGSYACICKAEYTGDPYTACTDIDECSVLSNPCGTNAVCQNTDPGFQCVCPKGFRARSSPHVACEQYDVSVQCLTNFDCVNNARCVEGQCFCQDGFEAAGAECRDVDECLSSPCGSNAHCRNIPGSYVCACDVGYIGSPPQTKCKAPCEGYNCGPHAKCRPDGEEAMCVCDQGWSYNPADIAAGCQDVNECSTEYGPSGQCGENALCVNSLGSFSCQCPPGFGGNPLSRCQDIDECRLGNSCGYGAICTNTLGSFTCQCPANTVPDPDPYSACLDIMKCSEDNDCPGNALCLKNQCMCPEPNIGDDCRHPCEETQCGPNAECKLINGAPKCLCATGFDGSPATTLGCSDIDECANNPCGYGAACRNVPGHFTCQCPAGFEGNAREGCAEVKSPGCDSTNPCPRAEMCIRDPQLNENVCVCQSGFTRDPSTGQCRDINECIENSFGSVCGVNAICKNLPGIYECQCPPSMVGNPFSECKQCDTLECKCQPPYRIIEGNCVLADCSKGNKCPAGAECVTIQGGVSYCACPTGFIMQADNTCKDIDECSLVSPAEKPPCAIGAECTNRVGTFECNCPLGTSGDPYFGGCSMNKIQCTKDSDCGTNEKCIQPGKCVCPPPFFVDNLDRNLCKNPCSAFSCGVNSKCEAADPPTCKCLPGFTSKGEDGCFDIDECAKKPCGSGAICVNEIGSFKCECPPGTRGDPFSGGCFGSERVGCSVHSECPSDLACENGVCINPCDSLPCGSNAYCEPEEHAAWCRCHPGFNEVFGEPSLH